ncbi:MAG: RNA 2',3'-cyclic phosphodiesterase [Treponema sp.]|jgi:2'-5' RNA ligase|nr:RNA 2',3'-cyclic phosphodiesterase [Treponema sp.]
MRLFIAVMPDTAAKRLITAVQEQIRSQSFRGKFVPPENLHLTLVFLGETPEDRLDEIKGIMDSITVPPFEARFSRAGFFRRAHKELWWLGPDPEESRGKTGPRDRSGLLPLQEIQRRLTADLGAAGFSIDTRPFRAHITLGREIRSGPALPFTVDAVTIPVKRISLVLSEHRRDEKGRSVPGQVYTELFGKDLPADEAPAKLLQF